MKKPDAVKLPVVRRKRSRGCPTVATMLCLGMLIAAGCESSQQFREAAGPALESGVNSILDGLVDGFFAVYEPDEPATATP